MILIVHGFPNDIAALRVSKQQITYHNLYVNIAHIMNTLLTDFYIIRNVWNNPISAEAHAFPILQT